MASTSVAAGKGASIMFLCLGNICRSPTAEFVFRKRAAAAGVPVTVESSGTASYHVGDGAYPAMVRAAAAKGYDLSSHTAQQISKAHIADFDLIIAMDTSNYEEAAKRFGDAAKGKLRLFLRDYAKSTGVVDTPDPYYEHNFDRVVELVEAGADGLIKALKEGEEPREAE